MQLLLRLQLHLLAVAAGVAVLAIAVLAAAILAILAILTGHVITTGHFFYTYM